MHNFIETFLQALIEENLDKKGFSERHKIHQSEVSRFVKHGIFSRAMSRCIFKGWKHQSTTIALYHSYFQDLIEAAELPVIIKFEPK